MLHFFVGKSRHSSSNHPFSPLSLSSSARCPSVPHLQTVSFLLLLRRRRLSHALTPYLALPTYIRSWCAHIRRAVAEEEKGDDEEVASVGFRNRQRSPPPMNFQNNIRIDNICFPSVVPFWMLSSAQKSRAFGDFLLYRCRHLPAVVGAATYTGRVGVLSAYSTVRYVCTQSALTIKRGIRPGRSMRFVQPLSCPPIGPRSYPRLIAAPALYYAIMTLFNADALRGNHGNDGKESLAAYMQASFPKREKASSHILPRRHGG